MILLVFGIAALVGIWVIGILIDHKLRSLVLISLAGFGLASVALGIGMNQTFVIYLAVTLWGLTFGGAATLLQTAIANAGGDGADVAMSHSVRNLGIRFPALGSFIFAAGFFGIRPSSCDHRNNDFINLIR
jgi:predicted MFS family arabinose efflux permease